MQLLKGILPDGMTVPTAYESVGHIAHLNLREEHLPFRHIIAQVVLDKNKPRIRTVVNKTDAIHSKYRTMQLELLAGNSSLVTTVVEHGLSFHLDLASVYVPLIPVHSIWSLVIMFVIPCYQILLTPCPVLVDSYWNSRLATERQRLITSFDPNDIVCDVFAGVGPIAVTAAKKVKYVYANDLNPSAIAYLRQNLVTNRLTHKVDVTVLTFMSRTSPVVPERKSP
jgi:tRNA (guanine37-N1)-methyltransferase